MANKQTYMCGPGFIILVANHFHFPVGINTKISYHIHEVMFESRKHSEHKKM